MARPRGMSDDEYRLHKRETDRAYYRRRKQLGLKVREDNPPSGVGTGNIIMPGRIEKVFVPPLTWETADKLARAKAQQDWAGYMLGDPPVGFRAIDRR